jgi:signal transduction histidine kinase
MPAFEEISVKQPIALVIDDDRCLRALLRSTLEGAGMQVDEAADGAGAVAAFQARRPDIVLLDVLMPQLDGFAVCRVLRRLPGAAQMPVLMLTGADDVAAIHHAYECGATDFVSKPINWAVLPYRLRYLLATNSDMTRRALAETELRQSKERLREVLAHQDRVKESERIRIAREIHDELGGVLTGIKSYFSFAIDQAERLGRVPEPHLIEAGRLADQAIETTRRVISDLRPSVLDNLGIWTALEWHAGQVEQQSGIACSVCIAPALALRALDADRSTALFRIVQESLTNVVRHAGARAVRIEADCRDGALLVSLRDDGRGFGRQQTERQCWGIEGMHERARYLGGDMRITSAPGRGTTVELRLPLEYDHAG